MSVTPISLKTKIDALLSRIEASFFWQDGTYTLELGVYCGICLKRILAGQRIDWDHHLRENAGGKTDYENVRPVHHECHREKRRVARSKATTLGKDNYEAKKTTRLEDGPEPSKRPMQKVSRPIPAKADPWGKQFRARLAQEQKP